MTTADNEKNTNCEIIQNIHTAPQQAPQMITERPDVSPADNVESEEADSDASLDASRFMDEKFWRPIIESKRKIKFHKKQIRKER